MVGHVDDAASEGRCGIPLRKIFRKLFWDDMYIYISKINYVIQYIYGVVDLSMSLHFSMYVWQVYYVN